MPQTHTDRWFMPGGGVKRGQTFDAAARREAGEEAGAELHNLSLICAFSNLKEWKSDHNIVFLFTYFNLSCKRAPENAELRFFLLDAPPEGLWPGHRRWLDEYRAQLHSPQFGEW